MKSLVLTRLSGHSRDLLTYANLCVLRDVSESFARFAIFLIELAEDGSNETAGAEL